jgi:hypothetical protein
LNTYAVATGDIRPDHLILYGEVWSILDQLPDGLDCHEVCAAIAERLPQLQHKRGYFLQKGIQHSWLEIPQDNIIIDAYPWAGAMPHIVTTQGWFNPWRRLFIEEGLPKPSKNGTH